MTKKETKKKNSLFSEIIPSLINSKKGLITDPITLKKEFSPYVVNNILTSSIDCFVAVEQANRLTKITDVGIINRFYKLHNFNIRSRFTFAGKRKKEITSEEITLIADYNKISIQEAEGALQFYTEEDISFIRTQLNSGGL